MLTYNILTFYDADEPPPKLLIDQVPVDGLYTIKHNGTHNINCSIPDSTSDHNLSLSVEVKNQVVHSKTIHASGDASVCNFNSGITKMQELIDTDQLRIVCSVSYPSGINISRRADTG